MKRGCSMHGSIRMSVLAAFSSLLPPGCGEGQAARETPRSPEAPTVVVVKVESKKLVKPIRLPGELWAYRNVGLFARVPGFVERIEVDRGAPVKAGQLLAELTAPELEAQ